MVYVILFLTVLGLGFFLYLLQILVNFLVKKILKWRA